MVKLFAGLVRGNIIFIIISFKSIQFCVCIIFACNFCSGESMGYIHCCGALHKTRTFKLAPQGKFLICELDYLTKCPICGHTVVQLTRIDNEKKLSVIRKVNAKAKAFYQKIKSKLLCEIKIINYNSQNYGKFYLNYNEFGVKKRCYSNLSTLKIGISENKDLKKNKNLK